MSARSARRLAMVLAGVVVVLGLGAGLAWRVSGGSWENIATPSMGTVAPVGSLVFTKPATVEDLRVGDIITYQPPSPTVNHTTTHRVVAIHGAGPGASVTTRGDNNGADDPWAIHSSDIRGRIEAILWGGGWLLRGVPMLALGMAAVWIATRYWTSARWTIPLRVLGFSAVVSTVVIILKPFVGAVSLGNTADAAGTHITLVSVGMLPSRFAGGNGGYVDLVDGQIGVLTTQVKPGEKGAAVTGGTHMPWWLWIVMVVIWLTPMIVGLIAEQLRQATLDAEGPDDSHDGNDPDDPDSPRPDDTPTGPMVSLARRAPKRRRSRVLATAGAMGFAMLALVTTTTSSAFTATVANTANTAASAPYFTCAAAAVAPSSEYLTWPLDDATVTNGSTARDAGGSQTGKYGTTFARTTDRPCPRDSVTNRTTAVTLTGSTTSYVTTTNATAVTAPSAYSVSLWFKTTNTAGGRMIGFSSSQTGTSTGNRDRSIHMNPNGTLTFGLLLSSGGTTYPGSASTPLAYNDGQWHQVVATWSAPTVTIYVDGKSVVSGNAPSGYTAASYTGYWRVGYDSLTNFVSNSGGYLWSGTAAWASVYTGALTAQQVSDSYVAGAS